METKDLYKVLGLSRGASQEDIRKAHRKLVRENHPDANPDDPQAPEHFKEIQQAYEVLSNEKKRREYDEELRTSSRGSPGRPRSRENSSRSRAKAGGRTGGESTYTVDLSELLGKLANLSREDGAGGRKEGSSQLRGEDVAHLAKHLGEGISRVSPLLEGHSSPLEAAGREHKNERQSELWGRPVQPVLQYRREYGGQGTICSGQ